MEDNFRLEGVYDRTRPTHINSPGKQTKVPQLSGIGFTDSVRIQIELARVNKKLSTSLADGIGVGDLEADLLF